MPASSPELPLHLYVFDLLHSRDSIPQISLFLLILETPHSFQWTMSETHLWCKCHRWISDRLSFQASHSILESCRVRHFSLPPTSDLFYSHRNSLILDQSIWVFHFRMDRPLEFYSRQLPSFFSAPPPSYCFQYCEMHQLIVQPSLSEIRLAKSLVIQMHPSCLPILS